MDVDGLFFRLGAKFDATFNQTLSEAQRAFAQVGDSLQSAGTAFGLFGQHITDAATAALKLGSDFQQTQIGFTTMLGSADKATSMLQNLKEFAQKTPFEFPGLVDASKRMLAFGFEADKIIPTLRTIGDAAAGLGGGAKSIDLITLALGQMSAKGKVSAQEMNQIAEQGVGAWKMLAANIGVSIPEAMKLAEKGAIDAATAIPAILKGMNDQFGGMMAKQAETVAGQWSNLKDQMTGVLMDLGAALLPYAQLAMDFLKPIGEGVKNAAKWFSELSPPLQAASVLFLGLAASIGPIMLGLGTLASAVVSISSAFAILTGPAAMGAAVAAMKALVVVAGLAAAAFVGWKIGEWLYQFGPVKTVIDAVSSAIGSMLQWIAKLPGVSSVVAGLSSTWDSLKGGIDKARESIANASKSFTAMGPTLDQLGARANQTRPPMLGMGAAAESAAKQAAAAAKQLEAHLASAWKGMSGFLMDMPKTFAQAQQMMANGFNIDAAIKRTTDEMQRLRIEFGDRMPPAAQQMYNALDNNRRMLLAFKDMAENLSLEQAFVRTNDAMNAYGTNIGRIMREQAETTKLVMDVAMSAANRAIADTVRLDGAFRQLGVTWSGELTTKANQAAAAFQLIVEANKRGEISATDMWRAQVKYLEAQIVALKAAGREWQQYEVELKGVQAALKASGVEAESSAQKHTTASKQAVGAASEMSKAWSSFGSQVSTVFTDFGKSIVTTVRSAKDLGDAFTKMGRAVQDAFMQYIVEGAIKQVMSGLGNLSKMLGGFGQQLSSLFGGLGFSGGGAGGGGGTGGGGGAGGLGGLLGGSNPVNIVTGITTAITGVLQTLQNKRMEADIGRIEVTSRGQLNQLISIQESMNKYLPLLENTIQLQRLEGIEQSLGNFGQGALQGVMGQLAQTLQQFGQGIQAGLQAVVQAIANQSEMMRVQLKTLIDVGIATYSLLNKPAGQGGGQAPPLNLNNLTQTTTSNRPPVTVNQYTQTSDPFRQGVQVVQGLQSALGVRL